MISVSADRMVAVHIETPLDYLVGGTRLALRIQRENWR